MSTLNLENIKHPDSASNNISVDSSGNTITNNRLTIGTPAAPQSPATDLHIRSSVPFIEMTDTEGGYGRVYLSNGNMLFDADHGNTQSDSYMTFRVDDSERMRIDSAGRVTMPYQPSFFSYYSAGFSVPAYNSDIVYDTVEHNIGSHYSTSTGRFTAPVTGIYRFVHKINTPINDTIEAKLNKNGTEVCRSYTIASTQNKTIYAVMSISLNANDYVTAGTYNPSASSVSHYGGLVMSHFFGYLVG